MENNCNNFIYSENVKQDALPVNRPDVINYSSLSNKSSIITKSNVLVANGIPNGNGSIHLATGDEINEICDSEGTADENIRSPEFDERYKHNASQITLNNNENEEEALLVSKSRNGENFDRTTYRKYKENVKESGKANIKLYKPHRSHRVQLPPVTVEIQKLPTTETKRKPLQEPVSKKSDDDLPTPQKISDEESEGESIDEVQGFWCFKYSRKQQLTLVSLCLVDFTSFLGMSIMAPFFPMEAADKGMDEATVGFVFSTYALVMFVASPIFGYILPKVGAKFMFLSGLFLAAGCTVLFGLLDELDGTMFVSFCFIIRSFEALGAAAYSTSSCTMVAEMFPDNIGAVFGILETFVGLGSSVGPAIGGALYAVGGFKLPFILLGIFMIIMVPVNIYLLPVQDVSSSNVKPGSTIRLLRLPTVIIMCFIIIVQASAWAFLDPFLEPHLSEFSLNTETVGLIFLMLSSTYAIFCPIWGWISDRWERTSTMMFFGMLITAVTLLFLGPSQLLPFLDNELWLNIVSLLVMGVSMALAIIPTFQCMMDYAIDSGFNDDISTYSLISGTWSAAYSLGDFVGPSIGGILVNRFDFATSATVIAGIIIAVAILLVTYEATQSCTKKSSLSRTIKKLSVSDLSEVSPLLKSI